MNRNGTLVAVGVGYAVWTLRMKGTAVYRHTLPSGSQQVDAVLAGTLGRNSSEVTNALALWGLKPDAPDPLIADVVAHEEPIRFLTDIFRGRDLVIGSDEDAAQLTGKVTVSIYESPMVPLRRSLGNIRPQSALVTWFGDDDHLFVITSFGTILEAAADGQLVAYDSLGNIPTNNARLPSGAVLLGAGGELLLLDDTTFSLYPILVGTNKTAIFNNTAVSFMGKQIAITALDVNATHRHELAFKPRLTVPFNNGAWLIGKTESVKVVLTI